MSQFCLVIIFAFFSLLSSCAKKAPGAVTNLGIRMPAVSSIEAITPAVVASTPYVNSGLWGLQTPATLAEIDCFGIAVSYPEGSNNSCHTIDATPIQIDEMFGTVPVGDLLQADILSGTGRNIQVIGMASSDGTCPADIRTLTKAQMANLSAPVILGSTTTDVSGDTMEVDVLISMVSPVVVNDCAGASYAWEEGQITTPTFALTGGYLEIVGSNLGSVHTAKIVDSSGVETQLSIQSKNNNGVAMKALSALNLAMYTVYQLFISNAYGQQVFPIAIGGAAGYTVKTVTANYQVTSADGHSFILTNARSIVTLPSAAAVGAGFDLIIKNIGTTVDAITRVETQAGEFIDQSNTIMVLQNKLSTINLTSDGANWWMTSSNGSVLPISQIGSCSVNDCYTNTTAQSLGWTIVTETGELFFWTYYNQNNANGNVWARVAATNPPGMSYMTNYAADRYLINDVSSNITYNFANNPSVAANYALVVKGTLTDGSSYGFMPDYLTTTQAIGYAFRDATYTTLASHAGVATAGFLNGPTLLSTVNNTAYDKWCAFYGGRMISQTDTSLGLSAMGDAYTYWTADSDSIAANAYLTFDGASGAFSGTGVDYLTYNSILCVWPNLVTSFGLQ